MLRMIMAASLMAGLTLIASIAQAQSFQPGWASWGGANLGANTLARQRAAIGQTQASPVGVRTAYRHGYWSIYSNAPPPPGVSYTERVAWARQQMIRAAQAKRAQQ